MLLGIDDSDDHWVLFLASLAAYELGLSSGPDFEGKVRVLARGGAADMRAEARARGSHCAGDFSVVDHLELAHLPLDEVRACFGVPRSSAPAAEAGRTGDQVPDAGRPTDGLLVPASRRHRSGGAPPDVAG